MAQLFQPTNITPDTRGAFGNGVILRDTLGSTYINVSWQINGNTPMTAYQIDFTDMSGTSLFSTGKLVLSSPVYGTSASGEPTLYIHVIGPIQNTSGLLQQSEGLMRITQWWGDGASDFVEQLSPSHYIVRDNPRVVIWSPSGSGATRVESFVGRVVQADEDGIMWMRWTLKNRNTSEIIKDTGKLYGSVEPAFTYDGFIPGNYTLELSIETSVGIQASGTLDIMVSYDMSDTGLPITASRDCNGESAVSVRWPRLQNIPLSSMAGSVTDNGKTITLPTDSTYLTWNTVNGGSMRLKAPWSVVWSGNVTALSKNLFTIQMQNVSYTAYTTVINGKGMLALKIDKQYTSQVLTVGAEWNEGPLMCILTPTAIYWKLLSDKGTPLYPREYLYPNETVFPGGLGGTISTILSRDISDYITQGNITSVTLHGPSSVKYFEIIDHAMQESEINQYLTSGITPSYNNNSLFYIKAMGHGQDYNAGNYPEALRNGTSIQIYRKSNDSSVLEYAGKMNVGAGNEFLDYAARSQQGPYTYYMYVLSSDKYINTPSVSNEVNPCFWNWTVLSCTENADGSYTVQASYHFGKNLQSGNISNNNQPGIFKNFTPYPTVMVAPQNYQGGTLQSLIGIIKDGEYSDTIDLRDAIYNLSLTTNTLFLKNRKGDLLQIRPSGEISMETMDNTRQQALTVSFPWVEVGDASGVAIYGTGGAT